MMLQWDAVFTFNERLHQTTRIGCEEQHTRYDGLDTRQSVRTHETYAGSMATQMRFLEELC